MRWQDDAACRGAQPDAFFMVGDSEATQRVNATIIAEYCDVCPVRAECLENAPEHGIWGGLTENERKKIRRREARARNAAESAEPGSRPIVDVELPPLGGLRDGQLVDSTETLALLAETRKTMETREMAQVTGIDYETLRKLMNRNGGKVTFGVARRVADKFAKVEAR